MEEIMGDRNDKIAPSYAQMGVLKKRAKEVSEQKYLDASKKRLEKIIGTKIRTAFIGALAAFEEEFGFLWGHDIDGPVTDEQKDLAQIWENVRTQILNNGNHQLRAAKQELENHLIKWNRYQYTLLHPDKIDNRNKNN